MLTNISYVASNVTTYYATFYTIRACYVTMDAILSTYFRTQICKGSIYNLLSGVLHQVFVRVYVYTLGVSENIYSVKVLYVRVYVYTLGVLCWLYVLYMSFNVRRVLLYVLPVNVISSRLFLVKMPRLVRTLGI